MRDKIHKPLKGLDYLGVELLDSHWKAQRDYVVELYLSMNDGDILKRERRTAGIACECDGLPGWGPNIGQYLGSYAKLYRVTGDARLRDKAASVFEGWAECVDKEPELLRNGTYGFDKLLGGFLDLYEYMGYTRVRDYVSRLTDRAIQNLDPSIPRDGLQDARMKGQIEWYTLPENLYRAYQLFGDEKYREFAEVWHYDYLWDKLLARDFTIGPRHAYSHVNCLSSAARAYEATGDEKYLEIMKIAYDEITAHHTYATGGYGPGESLFVDREDYMGFMLLSPWETHGNPTYVNFAGGTVARSDAWGSCEVSCCAWAVFKFCHYLLRYTGDAKYGMWAEQMLYNCTGGQPDIKKNGELLYYASYFADGAMKTTYDRRLHAGGQNFVWQCCSGTFPQDVAEYANMLYYHDEKGVYVSQYLPSRLTWNHRGSDVTVENVSQFPKTDTVRLRIGVSSAVSFTLKLRVPSWADAGNTVRVNGRLVDAAALPDTWLTLDREWQDGDLVDVTFPFRLRFSAVDQAHPDLVALSYGPITLVSEDMTILVGDREHPEAWIKPVPGCEMTFETDRGHTGQYEFITRRFSPYYTYPEDKWYFMYNRIHPEGWEPPRRR